MTDRPTPIPAATLVLMRERANGPPELLMTERAGHMAFGAGALVFPGGRIDPQDHEAATAFPALPDAAARIAAIRETIEEVAVAPAVQPAASEAQAIALRDGLADEQPFLELLNQHGLTLDLDALTPFARWCPNFRETRSFDTLFFLADAPGGSDRLDVAAHEAVRAFWASAEEILAELAAGKASALFPTRRNLERLARFGSIAEARDDAARHPVRLITPWIEERDGEKHVCIPDDLGYPVTSEPLETARRH